MTAVYRHKNGGGLKVYPAQASPDSFLDKTSTAEGESNVYESSLEGSALKDTFAYSSTVISATVAGSRLADAYLDNADIISSEIVGAHVRNSRLTDCRVYSNDQDKPALVGVSLVGVTVYGSALLCGTWGLDLPGAHIHAGIWNCQPRHILIEGEGIHQAVLECTEGRAHMGCECRPITYWLERGPRFARRFGWTEEQTEQCRTFLQSLQSA